ncbi:MAG: DMT family transporter [bacterium]|nr:DMT family transporter [bacterium]
MDWVFLSLVSGLAQASRNAAMKHLGHSLDEYISVLGRFLFILPFAAVPLLWEGVPELKPGFYWACFFFAISQTAATLFLSKALLYGDITRVGPLWKTSLIWLVVFAFFMLGETPSLIGLAGIGLTVAGVYLLNITRMRLSPLEPIRALFVDKGQRYALISAVLYAPSVATFKWAVLTSNTPFATVGTYAAAALCAFPVVARYSSTHFSQMSRHWKSFFLLGLFAALTSLSQGEAYRIQLSSYVESVKQMEIFFAMALGYFLFGEREGIREAVGGGAVIFLGVVLLILWG